MARLFVVDSSIMEIIIITIKNDTFMKKGANNNKAAAYTTVQSFFSESKATVKVNQKNKRVKTQGVF